MSKKPKKIVVLGGGFAGLHAVKNLIKNSGNGKDFRVTLVDKCPGHLYTPDLYEVATAYSEKYMHKSRLRKSVSVDFTEILDKNKFSFVHEEILGIRVDEKQIVLSDDVISYDYLVVALGAVSNYFGILGLKENSLPLKTAEDAIVINKSIMEAVKNMRFHDRELLITVAGGGVTGVEFSLELSRLFNKLSGKYKIERKRLVIQLIDVRNTLLDFSKKDLDFLLKRMAKNNVFVYLGHRVTRVSEDQVILENGDLGEKKLKFDLLVWTGGVKVNPLVANSLGVDAYHGAVPVDKYLKSEKFEKIFAGGDNAVVDGNFKPMLAQFAYLEGRIIAQNLLAEMGLAKKASFDAKSPVWVIPAGGKFAFLKYESKLLKGFIFWVLRRLIDLRYYIMILPLKKALLQWYRGTRLFVRND